MPEKSKGTMQSIARWRLYAAATRSNIADFPELTGELERFERDIEAFELENRRQEELKAQLRAATSSIRRRIAEMEKRATFFRRRWEARYGKRSPKLRELSPPAEGRARARRA